MRSEPRHPHWVKRIDRIDETRGDQPAEKRDRGRDRRQPFRPSSPIRATASDLRNHGDNRQAVQKANGERRNGNGDLADHATNKARRDADPLRDCARGGVNGGLEAVRRNHPRERRRRNQHCFRPVGYPPPSVEQGEANRQSENRGQPAKERIRIARCEVCGKVVVATNGTVGAPVAGKRCRPETVDPSPPRASTRYHLASHFTHPDRSANSCNSVSPATIANQSAALGRPLYRTRRPTITGISARLAFMPTSPIANSHLVQSGIQMLPMTI